MDDRRLNNPESEGTGQPEGAAPENASVTPAAQPAGEAQQPADPFVTQVQQPADPFATQVQQPAAADPFAAPAAQPTEPAQPADPFAQPAAQPAAAAQPMSGAADAQPQQPFGQPQQPGQPMPQQPGAPAGGPYYGQPGAYPPPAPQSNGKATAALVCGILAIVFCWAPLFGIILGVVALVMASKAIKLSGKSGKVTAGRICGLAGIILSVIMFVLALSVSCMAVNAIMEETNTTTSTVAPAPSTSDDSGSTSDSDINYTADEQEAVDALTARLDQYKSASDEAVAEIAALADKGFQEQTGFTMADCGVDSAAYARAVLEGFDYEISLVSAYEGDADGFVSADVTCRDAWGVLDTLNAKISDYTSSDEYASTTQEQDMAKMGEMLMAAAQEAPLSDTNYFSVDLVNNGSGWEIDQTSWDTEIDYLFGLA